jgi:hypothetical protein
LFGVALSLNPCSIPALGRTHKNTENPPNCQLL